MADRVAAQPTDGSPPQAPETLWQFVKLMFRGLRANLKRMLLTMVIQSVVIMLFSLFMNTYIIAYLNNGVLKFDGVNNPTQTWHYFLRLGKNQAAVDAICMLLFYALSSLYARVAGGGIKAFVRDLVGTPGWATQSLTASGRWGLPIVMLSAGLILVLTLATRNVFVFLTLAVNLFFSFTMRERNTGVLVAQLAWSDLQRVFRRSKPKSQAPASSLSLAILGLLVGALALALLPWQPYSALLLCALLVALSVLLLQRKIASGAALFVLGLVGAQALASRLAGVASAHDTGWWEGGATWTTWINSPGAMDLVLSGVRPGLWGIAGALLGGLFGSLSGGLASLTASAAQAASSLTTRISQSLSSAGQYVRETASWVRDFAGAFAEGVYSDFAGAASTIGGVASDAWNGIKRTASDVYDFGGRAWNDPTILIDKIQGALESVGNALSSAAGWASDTASHYWNNPWLAVADLAGAGEAVGNLATAIGNAIYSTVTDPTKAWEFIKNAVGVTNFQNSWDPNRSLLDRLGQVGVGVIKVYGAIVSGGKIASAVKSGATRVSAWTQAAGQRSGLLVGRPLPGQMPIRPGGAYVSGTRPPNMSHMTQPSQRHLQRIADQYGVQIHTRPGNAAGRAWLESGSALPKPEFVKSKTLNALDELIGGPRGREGLVGCFRPQLPPKEVMRSLSRDMQQALVARARMRNQEFIKYATSLSRGEYRIVNGVVQHGSGRFLAGDTDIFQIRNFNGGALPPQMENMVANALAQARGSNVTHEALSTWNGQASFNPRAAANMVNDARVGGQGVITFNPHNAPTQSFLAPDAPFY
jgi:hypothetical protein